MTGEQVYYREGYRKEIADSHTWRDVKNCAAYLIPHIRPNFKILDVGSGAGTITTDFGNYVPDGHVIGVEPTIELINRSNKSIREAEEKTGKKITNVSFQKGSIYNLPFEDNTFDLVHAHQVIIHLEDPIAGLKELKRVTKVGGLVGVKDADLNATIAYPRKYQTLADFYITRAKNAVSTDVIAGRSLRSKAIKAGYKSELIESSASIWGIADKDIKQLWSTTTISRIKASNEKLVVGNEALDKQKKQEAITSWLEFVGDEEAFVTMQNGEFVFTKD